MSAEEALGLGVVGKRACGNQTGRKCGTWQEPPRVARPPVEIGFILALAGSREPPWLTDGKEVPRYPEWPIRAQRPTDIGTSRGNPLAVGRCRHCPQTAPAALWYWNKGRQRNCYSLARYCSGLRVSADRAANRSPHTRAKAAVLDLQRPGRYETRTLRWRGPDSNLYGAFPVKSCFWFAVGSLFGAGKPFFVPSPAIRFAEGTEGVKGPKQ